MSHSTLKSYWVITFCLFVFSCGDDATELDAATLDGGLRDVGSAEDMVSINDDGGIFDDVIDQGDTLADSDAAIRDASSPDGGAPRSNPDVELIREITFEQSDGTDGWTDSPSVIFNWQSASTGRANVPGAMVRMATGINLPTVVNDVVYRGDGAVRLVMQDWGRETFRQDIEMVGNNGASPSVDRRFLQGETHVVGFAMRIEHASYPGGGFQLYHQYHNGSPPTAGYGVTNNPALSLLRVNDTDLQVALRDNRPGGERLNTFETIPGGVRAGQWVRWVFKTRFENYDSGENGLVEVWSAVGDEPLAMHVRVDDRPIGYSYANPDHAYETINFDMYGAPLQEDAAVYVDEVRIADGDIDVDSVDPINWVSYQHPLNQPFNGDLE